MKNRTILHCDCNSFFASVETVYNPSYKNVPMAVCGSQEDRHGIVLAKNEEAKKYGIYTTETIYSAKRKCPHLVICEPHHKRYVEYSRRVNEIYSRFTDLIEPFGIDESWLDVTASERLFGSGEEIAQIIRETVKKELGITVSIGVSFNKTFAKLGSDYKKPDAITVIDENNFKSIVYPLPVSDLLFVGNRTAELLMKMGIRTIGDLASASVSLLEMHFGKNGMLLHKCASGEEDSAVIAKAEEPKSIGRGCTFSRDLLNREECFVAIQALSEEIGTQLRKKEMVCSSVSLKIKDDRLVTFQRQKTLDQPTCLSRDISALAYEIFCENWKYQKPIRMLTVTAHSLSKRSELNKQFSLFADESNNTKEKNEKIEELKDNIRQRFGSSAIVSGSIMNDNLGFYPKKDVEE